MERKDQKPRRQPSGKRQWEPDQLLQEVSQIADELEEGARDQTEKRELEKIQKLSRRAGKRLRTDKP